MNKNITKITVKIMFLSLTFSSCDSNSRGLGSQIDSMGRPAINTALVSTFASDEIRAQAEDNYNSTYNFDRSDFVSQMSAQLAIYDSLAGTCGDNPVTNRASASPSDGLASDSTRYDFTSNVFADDHLYVNGSSAGAEAGACNQYLSAELGVIGVTGLETDCGGRTLTQDVIDVTYSAVALGSVSGVGDGVDSDDVIHSNTAFPFLAPAS